MQKVTFTFPDPTSLWLFKERSSAINVMIAPRKNMITGLFSSEEVETAMKEFKAIQMKNTSTSMDTSLIKRTETRSLKPLFRSRIFQLLSFLNV